MNRRNRALVLSGLGLILLILDGKTAIAGVQNGIQLCLNTLIPSLFPFCVISVLLTGNLPDKPLPILNPVSRFCRIPAGCASLLLIGWLGGYPVGAQNVATAQRNGALRHEDASRMVIFCNNPGPAFIFGMLGPLFPDQKIPWLIWGSILCGSLLTAHLIPGGNSLMRDLPPKTASTFPDAIHSAIISMATICANVLFLRMVLEFLSNWLFFAISDILTVLISGILEVSNGCILLHKIANPSVRCLMATGLLSFGGICVWLQTLSVCGNLNIKGYLKWKLVQCFLTVTIAAALLWSRVLSAVSILLIGFILFRFLKKRIAFPERMLYSNRNTNE